MPLMWQSNPLVELRALLLERTHVALLPRHAHVRHWLPLGCGTSRPSPTAIRRMLTCHPGMLRRKQGVRREARDVGEPVVLLVEVM